MIATTGKPDLNTLVECPDTGQPTWVWVDVDERGDIQVRGCERYCGELLCDRGCEMDAIATFAEAAEDAPHVLDDPTNRSADPRPAPPSKARNRPRAKNPAIGLHGEEIPRWAWYVLLVVAWFR